MRRSLLLAAVAALAVGCAGPWAGRAPDAGRASAMRAEPFHLLDQVDRGTPSWRASMHLVAEGLRAEAEGRPAEAVERYDRALQVEPSNPYAFLAIARYLAEHGRPDTALGHLEQAEALLASRGTPPGLRAHLRGLRGFVLRELGDRERGARLLEEARHGAPEVWADGFLDAEELL